MDDARPYAGQFLDLPSLMLNRHLQKCIPRELVAGFQERSRINGDNELAKTLDRKFRIVAVVGAGASAPIMARAKELVAELKKRLNVDDIRHEQKLERIVRRTGLPADTFETELLALTETPENLRVIRKTIARRYCVAHPTLLAYELLAHLLKHRFLDAIISFNFDELLDRSIADELGSHDYRRILSDRDCVGVCSEPDDSSYLPLFIKPHGTASDPASLRLTLNDYDELPDQVEALISSVLGREDCTIINIGYGLNSFDFNQILRSPYELRIFNLAKQSISQDTHDEIDRIRSDAGTKQVVVEDILWRNTKAEDLNSGCLRETDLQLNSLTWDVEKYTESKTDELAKFRQTDRHRATAELLNWDAIHLLPPHHRDEVIDGTFPETYEDYLRDRTILEIAYSALRSRGLVSLKSLVADRCGKYFDDYERVSREYKHEPEDWRTICWNGGLHRHLGSIDTFESIEEIRTDAPHVAGEDMLQVRSIDAEKLISHLKRSLSSRTLALLESFGEERLADTFRKFEIGSGFEVTSQVDSSRRKLFNHPLVLPDMTSLRMATAHLLGNETVRELSIVSELGRWLLDPYYQGLIKRRVEENNLHIRLVVAFPSFIREIEDFYGKDNVTWISSHWWRVNRMMTIVSNDENPIGAVYFTRRHRTAFVAPIYVDGRNDTSLLLDLFKSYWRRAQHEPRGLTTDDVKVALPELVSEKFFDRRLRDEFPPGSNRRATCGTRLYDLNVQSGKSQAMLEERKTRQQH